MLTTRHPQYTAMLPMWESLRDFHAGSNAVKAAGIKYLPPTDGMEIDGMKSGERGYKAYQAYKMRARVPDYITEGVRALLGLLHQKPATIRLPKGLEYLRHKATPQGETLVAMHRRINFEQLVIGRVGLLSDIGADGGDPYVAVYSGERITNWNVRDGDITQSKLQMVVLDETTQEFTMSNMGWAEKVQYRVAWLQDGKYVQKVFEGANRDFDPSDAIMPNWNGRNLEAVPFEFINGADTLSDIDNPPLQALLDICIGIYLGEADYRQNLYMQGQQTLVVIGGVQNPNGEAGKDEDAIRTGAGARIDVGVEGDAKYIGVTAAGLEQQAKAIESDRRRAELKAGELVQNSRSQAESGKAMATRYNAQTATLNQLATASGEGLQSMLRRIAEWMGEDPEEVVVIPNTEFIDFSLDGQSFGYIMSAIRENGLPLSLESVHEIMSDRGLTKLDFKTEMERIGSELTTWAPVIEMMQKLTAAQAQQTQQENADAAAAKIAAQQKPTGNVAGGNPGNDA